MKGGSKAPWPELPGIRDRLGDENPARFLWYCERGLTRTAAALVRGMDDLGRVNGWIAAEKRLAEHHPDAPRQKVLEQLELRRDYLLVQEGALDPDTFAETHGVELDASAVDPDPTPARDTAESTTVASDGGATATEPAIDEDDGDDEAVDPDWGCPVCSTELAEEPVADAVGLWCSECGAFRGRLDEDGEPVLEEPSASGSPTDRVRSARHDPEEQRAPDQSGFDTFGGGPA